MTPRFATPDALSRRGRPARRAGFTLTECSIAMAALLTAGAVLAELVSGALSVRNRQEARVEAGEVCANVIEEARAAGWGQLTPEWAAARKPPESFTRRWSDSKLTATVAPEPGRPLVKRVTVEVSWTDPRHKTWPVSSMVVFLAARTAGGGS